MFIRTFQTGPGTAARVCLWLLLVCGVWTMVPPADAANPKFRISSQSVPIAAGKSTSSRFALDSCIDPVMAGASTGSRFKLQTGCGASFSNIPLTQSIPAMDPWSRWLLLASVLGMALVYLRTGTGTTI